MNEADKTGAKAAPQIRCPSCAAHVRLPAEICPRCRYDFRTDLKAPVEDEEPSGRMGMWLTGGLVLAAVMVLAFVFLFRTGDEAAVSAPALPPTASAVPDSEIGEALANFDSLTDAPVAIQPRPFEELTDDPLLLQPHRILQQSREVIDGLNEQQKLRGEEGQ